MKSKQTHFFVLLFSFLFLIFSFKPLKKFLPDSPFIIVDTPVQKACSEFGCLEISDKNEVVFHQNSFAIKAAFKKIENLYILKEKVQKLEGVMSAEGSAPCAVKIAPDYASFTNEDEMDRNVTTFIEAPVECVSGIEKDTKSGIDGSFL